MEDYDSGPYCRHWSDYCERLCGNCEHDCAHHYFGDGQEPTCSICDCKGWVDKE